MSRISLQADVDKNGSIDATEFKAACKAGLVKKKCRMRLSCRFAGFAAPLPSMDFGNRALLCDVTLPDGGSLADHKWQDVPAAWRQLPLPQVRQTCNGGT